MSGLIDLCSKSCSSTHRDRVGGTSQHHPSALPSFLLGPSAELRPLSLGDADALLALLDRERESLRAALGWLDRVRDLEGVNAYIEVALAQAQRGKALRLALVYRGELAGIAGLHQISREHRSASLGYWLGSDYERQGLMTAAVATLCRYGLGELGLARIELATAVHNTRSRALAERLAFRFEGILRSREWLYDHFVDHAVYSLVTGDPLPHVPALPGDAAPKRAHAPNR